MLAADCIRCHKVNLWPVEGCFAFLLEELKADLFDRRFELTLSRFPQCRVTQVCIRFIAVAQAHAQLHADSAVEFTGRRKQVINLAFNLVRPAKDVAIVLG